MRRLKTILPKKSGRSRGRVTVRHQGGRRKRYYREIDFNRDKFDVWGIVEDIQYDPNRNSLVALVSYSDGERRYIITPEDLKIGDKVISSDTAPLEIGNSLPISKIPIGTQIHNLEITPGKGAQVAKSAGSSAVIQGREAGFVLVKMPSSEIRRFDEKVRATIGQISNPDFKHKRVKNAGVNRRRGIRPTVRGVAQHPGSHPHGGGEGRSGVGLKYPKTPTGKPAVGKTRRKTKYSDKLIIKGRKPGKHS